jgi:low affinity Fe/Cu permease
VENRFDGDESALQHRQISHRRSQPPIWNRILYKIEHYTVVPAVALVVTATVVSHVVAISILDFPKNWVAAFELSAASVTLIMVFAIQHTQGREQAATQRKLDELIRAFPGANEALMMLEEAPRGFMLDVEDEQRNVRLNSPDTNNERRHDNGTARDAEGKVPPSPGRGALPAVPRRAQDHSSTLPICVSWWARHPRWSRRQMRSRSEMSF